jgi:hypothetical protein
MSEYNELLKSIVVSMCASPAVSIYERNTEKSACDIIEFAELLAGKLLSRLDLVETCKPICDADNYGGSE